MAIKDWPRSERPREKLLKQGAQSLTDAELLAIFLRTGIPGKTAVDLARELMAQYNGLRPLLEADFETFCSAPGLGLAKFAQLQAILEMSRRHLRETLQRGGVLEGPQQTRDYLACELRGYEQEVFACLFLDNRHRVVQFDKLFFGTINSATVHPREVVKKALGYNAAAVILSHNHPSGVSEPSQADIDITLHLKEALALVDVRVLDHFIVGDGELVSLAERGLMG